MTIRTLKAHIINFWDNDKQSWKETKDFLPRKPISYLRPNLKILDGHVILKHFPHFFVNMRLSQIEIDEWQPLSVQTATEETSTVTSPEIWTGIMNRGNSCYVGAALQFIFSTRIGIHLMSMSVDENDDRSAFFCNLRAIFQSLHDRKNTKIDLNPFYDSIPTWEANSRDAQHDSFYFVDWLLDMLLPDPQSSQQQDVLHVFDHTTRFERRCSALHCSHAAEITLEPKRHLQLSLRPSVQDALDLISRIAL